MGIMGHRVFRQAAEVAVSLFLVCPSLFAADCGLTPYDCAVSYIGRHNLPAAIQSLNQALQQSPRDLKSLNLLGIALTESGQVEAANSKFKEALAIDASFYPARKNLAINEFVQQRFPQAAADLNRVLQQMPTDEITHIYLGEI